MSLLDLALIAAALAVTAAASFCVRRKGAAAVMLVWLFGFPCAYAAAVFLTLLVSFQVFGIDLLD